MKKGINLARGRKKVAPYLKKLLYGSILLFTVVVLGTIGLTLYKLFLTNTFTELDVKDQTLNAQLLSLKDKNEKFIETKKRLIDIQNIIAKRTPTDARLSTISSLIPENSTVHSIDGDSAEISISLESESLSELNNLVEQKIQTISEDKNNHIKKIETSSLALNPKTLLYSLTLSIYFE